MPLMSELGYKCHSNEPVKKPRGKYWNKTMRFTHSSLSTLTLKLWRKRRQEGGRLSLVYMGTYEVTLETISASAKSSCEVMSRQSVGDMILNHIREGWSKSREAKQED